jgi:Annexin
MTRDRADRRETSSQQSPKTALPQPSQRGGTTASQPGLMFNLQAKPLPGEQQPVDPAKIEKTVGALYRAMDGLGTDEAAIIRALSNKTPAEIDAIKATYKARYGEDLKTHLREELSGADLSKALSLLNVSSAPKTGAPGGGKPYAVNAESLEADRLHDAMAGVGTDEAKILSILKGKTPAQINAISAAYKRKYKTDLEAALRSELSGKDLSTALALLSVGDGSRKTFPKEITDAANKLFKAIDGAGTDEAAIFDTLQGKTPQQLEQIKAAYKDHYRRDLVADLKGDLSGEELALVMNVLNGGSAKVSEATRHAREALDRLQTSIGVFNDDEAQIEVTLSKLSPEARLEFQRLIREDRRYKTIYARVRGSLGGSDQKVFDALVRGDRAAAAAERIAEAIEGLGTNETQVYKQLSEKVEQYLELEVKPALQKQYATDPSAYQKELERARTVFLNQVKAAYKARTKRELSVDIDDDFSGAQKDQAQALLEGDATGASAARIHEAMDGLGTDEAAINAELKGKTASERAQIMTRFAAKYGEAYKPIFIRQFVQAYVRQHRAAYKNNITALYTTARAEAEKAFDPQNPQRMKALMMAVFQDELSGDDLSVATQNLEDGKTQDALALKIAIEGAGTDENAVKEILSGKTASEIQALELEYQKLTGRSLRKDLLEDATLGFTELDGRDAFEVTELLEGEVVTADMRANPNLMDAATVDRLIRRELRRYQFERGSGGFSSGVMNSSERVGMHSKGSMLDYNHGRLLTMIEEVKDGQGKLTYRLKPDFSLEDLLRVTDYHQTDTKSYVEAKATVTQALKTGGEIVVATLVTVLTEGAAAPWLIAVLSGVAGTATGIGIQMAMDNNGYGASSIGVDALKGVLTTALGTSLAKGLPINDAIEEMAMKFGDQFTKETLRKLAQQVAEKSTQAAIEGAANKTIDNILNDDNWRKGAAEYFQAIFKDAALGALKGGLSSAAKTVLNDIAKQGLTKLEIENAIAQRLTKETVNSGVSEAVTYLANVLEDKDNETFENILRNILRGALEGTAKGIAQDKLDEATLVLRFRILANVANDEMYGDWLERLVAAQVKELNLKDDKYEDVLKKLDQQQLQALQSLVDTAKQTTSEQRQDEIRQRIQTKDAQRQGSDPSSVQHQQ